MTLHTGHAPERMIPNLMDTSFRLNVRTEHCTAFSVSRHYLMSDNLTPDTGRIPYCDIRAGLFISRKTAIMLFFIVADFDVSDEKPA